MSAKLQRHKGFFYFQTTEVHRTEDVSDMLRARGRTEDKRPVTCHGVCFLGESTGRRDVLVSCLLFFHVGKSSRWPRPPPTPTPGPWLDLSAKHHSVCCAKIGGAPVFKCRLVGIGLAGVLWMAGGMSKVLTHLFTPK